MSEPMDERLRDEVENAVNRALEAGVSADRIREEVEYAIENYEPFE